MKRDLEFSVSQAEQYLERVRHRIDAASLAVYKRNEYFHDAYIRKVVVSVAEDHRTVDVALYLEQDVVHPYSQITVTMINMPCLDFDLNFSSFLGSEIYYFYLTSHEDGIQVLCSTDDMIQFEGVAQRIVISETIAED